MSTRIKLATSLQPRMKYSCYVSLRVDPVKGAVELSLRLSHVDPVAAKLERRRKGKRKGGRGGEEEAAATRKRGRKVTKVESTSDGDSMELRYVKWTLF